MKRLRLKLHEGNIGVDIQLPRSSDEIRSVAEAFQQMVYNLRSIVEQIETNFEKTAETIGNLSAGTRSATEQADVVASTIMEISAGAEESAVAIQETAEAVEDIRLLAVEVNNRAGQSTNRSRRNARGTRENNRSFSNACFRNSFDVR